MSKDNNIDHWLFSWKSNFAVKAKKLTSSDMSVDADLHSGMLDRNAAFRPSENDISSPIRRLIVLIPDQDVDEIKISRKILSQAFSRRLDIVLVTLVQNNENEYIARRRLATMLTLLKGPQLIVETKVMRGHSWHRILSPFTQRGDMIFCPVELTESSLMGTRKSLKEALKNGLHLPVVTYAGFYRDPHTKWPTFFQQARYWMILSAIFILFFLFDINLTFSATGWTGQVLTYIIVIIEIGVLYYWTSIAG